MNNKSNRHEFIKAVIGSREIGSQDELLAELNRAGYSLTQATLSRDLKKLKIAKASRPTGNYVYVLPSNENYELVPDNVSEAQTSLRNFGFISIEFSGNIAVIKTKPGYASSLAYDIDNHHLGEIIGTIAGDDTIMLIIKEGCTPTHVKTALTRLIPNIIYY